MGGGALPVRSPGTGPVVWSSRRSAAAPAHVACTTGTTSHLSQTSTGGGGEGVGVGGDGYPYLHIQRHM